MFNHFVVVTNSSSFPELHTWAIQVQRFQRYETQKYLFKHNIFLGRAADLLHLGTRNK